MTADAAVFSFWGWLQPGADFSKEGFVVI